MRFVRLQVFVRRVTRADYQELKHKYQELEHELRRQRARAGNYKSCWEKARTQLDAKNEEVKRISRVAKSALSLDKEVQRLRALLEEVGVDTRKRSAIVSLRMEIGSLKNENAELNKQVKNLLSNRKVLSNSLYGSRSEKQKRPPSGRRRGQQPGAPGHGRTARPDIEVVEESWYPSEDELTCSSCGKPYVGNGKRVSQMYEIEVKAYKRKVNRFRHRRACDCESSPLYVTASAPVRLFKHTQYGISVWDQLIHSATGT